MTDLVINRESKIVAQMAFKLFISTHTYRTPEQQHAMFDKMEDLKDAPRYAPEDLPILFRATTRKMSDTLVAVSVGCFAKTDEAFIELLMNCRYKGTCLEGLEEGFQWRPGQSNAGAIKAWREARAKGSAVIGGRISAERKEAASKGAVERIRDRWPLPSQEWKTAILLNEADLSYNTAIKFLGKRPIAQYNYQAKLKRKANAKR